MRRPAPGEGGTGPQPAPEAWAQARLVQGKSRDQSWAVTNESRQVRVSVGADPKCRWHVTGQGVESLHFELYWDGAALWAADTTGAGNVNIDGVPLGDWTQVTGRVRIAFGRAAMIVETSLAADVSVLAGGAAGDGTALDLPREGAVVLRGPVSDRDTRSTLPDPGSAPSLADGATHLLSSPPDLSGLSPDDTEPFERWPGDEPKGRRAAVGSAPPGRAERPPQAAAPAARAAEPDTRIAVPTARGATPRAGSEPSARAAAAAAPAAPTPIDQAATRLVASPAPAPTGKAAAAAPPGVLARPRLGQDPPPAFHDRATVIVPSSEDAGLPDLATEPSEPLMHVRPMPAPAPAAAATAPSPRSAPAAQGPPPMTLPGTAAPGTGPVPSASEVTPFAQPPSDTGMRASPVVKAESPSTKKMAMPLRTWLLFGLVVVAAAAAVLLDDDDVPAPAPRTATAAQPTAGGARPAAGQPAGGAGTQAAVVPQQGMAPVGPTPALEVARIATPVPTSVPVAPAGGDPAGAAVVPAVAAPEAPAVVPAPAAANAATPESEAADLLITGHHREALERYERLAAERPETATFGAIAKILRRRLAAQCRDGYGPGGEPCTTP